MMHKHFPDGNCNASYDEFIEYMKGFNEPVDDHMGATFIMEIKDTLMIFILKKK